MLVGLVALVLLWLSLDSTSSEVAYPDGSYTVTVKESSSWMDNEPLPAELELYCSHRLFFDQYLGHIGRSNLSESVSELKARWQAVSAISYDAYNNRGVAGGRRRAFQRQPALPSRRPASTRRRAYPLIT